MPLIVRSEPGLRIASAVGANTSTKPTCCSAGDFAHRLDVLPDAVVVQIGGGTRSMFSLAIGETSTIRGAGLAVEGLRLQAREVFGEPPCGTPAARPRRRTTR